MTPQHFLIIPTYCVCFSLVTVIFVVVGKEWALPLVPLSAATNSPSKIPVL